MPATLCPTTTSLAESIWLGPPAASELEAHLADCARCRRVMIVLERSTPASPVGEVPARRPPIGTDIGRYRVRELVGAGAMGVVYAAHDPTLGRDVALKLLHPELAADPEVARIDLLAEAKAMARIRHPNVVAVYDAGGHGEQIYVAMQLVAGTSLRGWLRTRRPWRDIVRVMTAAGRGLAGAHAHGLVHRDFKPENVLLGDAGEICVGDFGLACAPGEAIDLAGTPAYMAPEQLAGAPPAPSADQYSFCRVLARALDEAASDRPPRWLAALLERGTARDPSARFPSVAGLVRLIEQRAARPRRRLAIGLAIAGGLAVVGATAVAARGVAGSPGDEPCAGAGDVPAAWLTSRPAAVASAAGGQALARIAAWTARWSAMRGDACRATRVRGVESEDLLDLRMTCLDRRAREVAALLEQLAPAAAGRVGTAFDQVLELEGCAGEKPQLQPFRVQVDPALRAAAERMRAALDEGAAKVRLGSAAAGIRVAEEVAAEAGRLRLANVEAEALHLLARGRVGAANDELAFAPAWREATAATERALVAAEGAGLDRLRADLYLVRANIHRVHGRLDESAHALDQARAVIGRLGEHAGGVRIQLQIEDGFTAFDRGDLAAGHRALAAAADARRVQRSGDDATTALLWARIGGGYIEQDRPADGRPHLEHSLAIYDRLGGHHDVDVFRVLTFLCDAAAREGRNREAIAYFERAYALSQRLGDEARGELAHAAGILAPLLAELDRRAQAIALVDRAVAAYVREFDPKQPAAQNNGIAYGGLLGLRGSLRALGGDRGALADLDRGFAILDRVGAPDDEIAALLEARGTACRHLGLLDDAAAAFERALALPTPREDRLQSLLGLGQLHLDRGAPARALPHLERAVALDARSDDRAEVRFALARALAATGGDPRRASALALEARDLFATGQTPAAHRRLAATERWLRARPHSR